MAKILIVEDNEMNRDMLSRRLARSSCGRRGLTERLRVRTTRRWRGVDSNF
jgi:CheY-like chemotaxis protein